MNDYARFENDGRPKDVLNKPVLIMVLLLLLLGWIDTSRSLNEKITTGLMLGLAIWLVVVMNGDWVKLRNFLFSLSLFALSLPDYETFVFTVLMMVHIVILLWLVKVVAFYAIYHKRASLKVIIKGQVKAELWAVVLIPLLYLVFTYLFYFLIYQNNLQFYEELWEQMQHYNLIEVIRECYFGGEDVLVLIPLSVIYGYWGASIDYHYLSQAVYGRKLKYWEPGAEHMMWVLVLLNLPLYWILAMLYNMSK